MEMQNKLGKVAGFFSVLTVLWVTGCIFLKNENWNQKRIILLIGILMIGVMLLGAAKLIGKVEEKIRDSFSLIVLIFIFLYVRIIVIVKYIYKERIYMELNKCTRCGCFYVSSNDVCPTCEQKDVAEIDKLKNFLEDSEFSSIDDISYQTGITVKNLNRFLKLNDFKKLKNL